LETVRKRMENNRIEKQITVYKSGEEEFTKNAEEMA
jgi:hypothetical protein